MIQPITQEQHRKPLLLHANVHVAGLGHNLIFPSVLNSSEDSILFAMPGLALIGSVKARKVQLEGSFTMLYFTH